ncbi:MAG TPA: ThiF family adenylyltransferase [Nonomuraea sp.]|nr:ThiF family adenylyltransferase [Nonomuraea sp.]
MISIGGRQHGVGAEFDDDGDGTLWRLLELMDGSRTEQEIIDQLIGERPALDRESLGAALKTLIEAGYVEDAAASPPPTLSAEELARYDRSLNYFAWVDMMPRQSRYELQARLKAGSVTVCGLGGTGSAVAAALVAAGVGAVHCVDHDRVEAGNLTRQLLYTEDDIGAPKVEVAVARLRTSNRYVEVTGEERLVGGERDLAELMAGRDLFVLAADEPRETIVTWANAAALTTSTPWLIAQYAGPTAVTGLFVPGVTGCYACLPLVSELFENGRTLFDWQGHAVLAPTANLAGHLAALEAIYFLVGMQPSSLGRVFHLSLTDFSHNYFVGPRTDVDCEICGRRRESP